MPTTEHDVPLEFEVRPALASDVVQMAWIHVHARAAAPMPDALHGEREVQRWLAGRIAGDEAWVAVRGTRVLGYARFGPGWLDDLYVDPEVTGHGVGAALLDVVKTRLRDGFCLWVFEQNTPARRFYAARGMFELEWTDGSSNDERAPDIKMVWPGAEPLAYLRRLIDDVDLSFGDLLARRVALTAAVQQVKRTQSAGDRVGRDERREREVAERVASRVVALDVEQVDRIMQAVITESLRETS